MSVLGPCGLAKLPEELVDMVCSFIVSFADVKGASSLSPSSLAAGTAQSAES